MPVALGSESYMCPVMQTAFGAAEVPTVTHSHLRTGEPLTPRQAQNPRVSTARIMPGADQLWTTMNLTDFQYDFELTGNATAWLPILRCAWGKELATAATPNVRTYTIVNPPVESGVDGTPVNTTWNHAMTIRHTFASGGVDIKTYEINDCSINEFTFGCTANETMRMGISGTGQGLAGATMVNFAEPAGTPYGWSHHVAGANGGIYSTAGAAGTTAMPVKSYKFTLNNNLRYEPFLGNVVNKELKLPTRNGYPSAMCEYEMDFDDISATDAVSIMTDYLAGTTHSVRIKAYIDASNAIELVAASATPPAILDSPRPSVGSEGVVSFRFQQLLYPAVVGTDLKLVFTTAT